jgi:hypothetical protein
VLSDVGSEKQPEYAGLVLGGSTVSVEGAYGE